MIRIRLPDDEVASLEQVLRTTADAKLRHRVQIVLMAQRGRPHPAIATDTATRRGAGALGALLPAPARRRGAAGDRGSPAPALSRATRATLTCLSLRSRPPSIRIRSSEHESFTSPSSSPSSTEAVC